ncbi:hypothetical protein E1301_Tti024095 [Triplophysa tibetana]|uniref:Uncharacterized protein n=1 Tax=Triplophysa tibetana TaxID=1572043 RepID=A0A5A9NYE2_9TELE|nr:hypothetical protein E1301_Tti024095 [Triplophysa tibetana]
MDPGTATGRGTATGLAHRSRAQQTLQTQKAVQAKQPVQGQRRVPAQETLQAQRLVQAHDRSGDSNQMGHSKQSREDYGSVQTSILKYSGRSFSEQSNRSSAHESSHTEPRRQTDRTIGQRSYRGYNQASCTRIS